MSDIKINNITYSGVDTVLLKTPKGETVKFTEGERPAGTIEITTNGTHNVANYANANVNVPTSGGGTDRLQWQCDNVKSLSYSCSRFTGTNVDEMLVGLDTSKVTNMSYMFYYSQALTTIPQLDTSNVTDMQRMFMECRKLTEIPQLDTSNVTNMAYMVSGCRAITAIPQFNTSSVTNMQSMFDSCSALTTIPQLDTSNVYNMNKLFYNCSSLITIPQLNTSKVTDMQSIFYGCSSLTEIPQLDTSKITSMASMFQSCKTLETIPLIDMINITNVNSVFQGCVALKNLTLKNIKKTGLYIGLGTSYGHLLTVDSLVNTIKELWAYTSGSYTLTMGSVNKEKLADVYVKLITPTAEQIEADPNIESKMPCEVCASTDEGAMLILDYATLKKWSIS